MTNSTKYQMSLILWSLAWAFAFIAAAFLFKGKPEKFWIESAIFVAAVTHLMWKRERRTRCG
jgi:hypothetical protein